MRPVLVWMVVMILALPGLAAALAPAGSDPTPALQPRLFVPLVTGDRCGDFYDDFSIDTGWFTGQRDGLLAERQNGEYRLLVTRPGFVWLVGAPDCARVGNHATVDARWDGTPGNFYGLLISEDGRLDRSYLLAVNSDARVWLLLRVHDDGVETVISPTRHDAVRAGGAINRLSLTREGGRLVFAVNDVTVGEASDPGPDIFLLAGVVAASYTAQAPADARFDNFVHRGAAGGTGRSPAARASEAVESIAIP